MLGIFKKSDSPQYELFCCSVRGYSHIKKNTPCEDYCVKKDCAADGVKIFAVADGHGDPNCLRSSLGSEYACRIACESLENFARNVSENGFEDRLFDRLECPALIDRLVRSIIAKWTGEVDAELSRNPLTDQEYAAASRLGEEYRKGIRTERMYGTTLIAGLLTERYLLLIQQGDGRCVVFDGAGKASQPIPWDDRCVGTATTSLCDPDAAHSVRYHVINLEEDPVIACIVGTDVVEDSFPTSMEKTHAYYRNILKEACEMGVTAMEQALTNDLSDLSRQGSADDVSVSGFVDVKRTRKFLADFENLNQIVNIRDELALVKNRIKSMESGGMLEHLAKTYDGLALSYRTSEEKYRELDRKCRELQEKIDAHEQTDLPEQQEMPLEIRELLSKLRFSKDMLAPAKKELETLTAERDEAKMAYDEAATKMGSVEERYLPRKEKYEALLKQKSEIMDRLNELEAKQ